jgi:phospholipid transport system transporter-binding protein
MLLLPATLTSREARVTLRMLQQALQSEGSETPVVVEAGSLQQLDSAALAVLLEIERLAVAWGRAFVVRGVPAKLAALAKLYGVDVLLLKPEPAVAAGAVGRSAQAGDVVGDGLDLAVVQLGCDRRHRRVVAPHAAANATSCAST